MLELFRTFFQFIFGFPLVTLAIVGIYFILTKKLKDNWIYALVPFIVLLIFGIFMINLPHLLTSNVCGQGVKVFECDGDDRQWLSTLGAFLSLVSAEIILLGSLTGYFTRRHDTQSQPRPKTKKPKASQKHTASSLALNSTTARILLIIAVVFGTPFVGFLLGKLSGVVRNDPSGISAVQNTVIGILVGIAGAMTGLITSYVTKNSQSQKAATIAYIAPSAVFVLWCIVRL